MRTFTTKGGQIFEVWESRKEALHDVADIIDGIRYAIEIGLRLSCMQDNTEITKFINENLVNC